MDDLQEAVRIQPSVTVELTEALARYSGLTNIRWLIGVDSSRLDSVLSLQHNSAWKSFGFGASTSQKHQSVLQGWWDLDSSNVVEQLGLELLERTDNLVQREDLKRLRKDASEFEFAGRFYCDPLPAWLHSEQDTKRIGEFGYTQAATTFCEKVVLEISSEGFKQEVIVELLNCVTAILISDAPKILVTEVFEQVAMRLNSSVSWERMKLDEILAELQDRRLIYLDVTNSEISPRTPVIWTHLIVKEIRNQIGLQNMGTNAIKRILSTWQARADEGDWLAASVVSATLIALGEETSSAASKRVWAKWYDDESLSNSPLWVAASNVASTVQAQLALKLEGDRPILQVTHELYVFMRFLIVATDSLISGSSRIGCLRRHYFDIGQHGLGDFFYSSLIAQYR